MPRTICHPAVIDDYLNDILSPEDEASLEQHLNDCLTCRDAMSTAAGSGDDWTTITAALRPDELDEGGQTVADQLLWPLTLLGPTDDPRMLGRIGPFEVSACVGVGGMGVVFKARDPALDRYVAVKVLSPQLAASETARSRFEREAKAAAAVVHDNVIAVHQVSEYQGLPYLVMPYLPGPSLEERLRREGPMAPVEALRIARQVAAGLKAAHAQGLIHRDIKPANILLSGDTERAMLTDFGLARAVDDATITRAGALAGTPQFMAPEQARGETIDERSDLFSLGALLFAMLTGHPPVPDASGAETVRKVGSVPPPRLSDVLDDVPRPLEKAVAALHRFQPEQRLPTAARAESMLEVLVGSASPHPLRPRKTPAQPSSRQTIFQRINPGMRSGNQVVLTALLTCLLLIASVGFWQSQSADDANPSQQDSTIQTDLVASSIQQSERGQTVVKDGSNTLGVSTEPFVGSSASDATMLQPSDNEPAQIDRPQDPDDPVLPQVNTPLEDVEGIALDKLLQSIGDQMDRLENR